MRSTAAFFTVTLCASTGIGCYSTWDIVPTSVTSLDGMREGRPKQVETAGGDKIEVSSDTQLRFRAGGGTEAAGIFRSIDVQGGTLVAVEEKRGPLYVDLAQLTSVQAKELSVGKTVGLTLGLTFGVPTVALGVTFIVLASSGGFGGGRPLRFSAGASPARAALRVHRAPRLRPRSARARGMDDATRARIFAHWAREASAEGASIPAFLALARDLELAGAPSALVTRALDAAREEAAHTAICADLASDHAGAPISAEIPALPPNADGDHASLIRRLAVEAFEDGCLAEGAAAAVARRSAIMAGDERAARALQRIAREEQGHADLAEQIAAHCLSVGGRAVRDALVESFRAKRAELEAGMILGTEDRGEASAGVDEDLARRGGVPAGEVIRAAQAEAWDRIATRFTRL